MSEPEASKIVDAALAILCEHFEAVQILTSTTAHDGTHRLFKGAGNWYARQGMAHEFIRMDQARTDADELARVINPPV